MSFGLNLDLRLEPNKICPFLGNAVVVEKILLGNTENLTQKIINLNCLLDKCMFYDDNTCLIKKFLKEVKNDSGTNN